MRGTHIILLIVLTVGRHASVLADLRRTATRAAAALVGLVAAAHARGAGALAGAVRRAVRAALGRPARAVRQRRVRLREVHREPGALRLETTLGF